MLIANENRYPHQTDTLAGTAARRNETFDLIERINMTVSALFEKTEAVFQEVPEAKSTLSVSTTRLMRELQNIHDRLQILSNGIEI